MELLADMLDEIDAGGFDIRAHGAGRNCFQAQDSRVLGDLLALNQADLPPALFTGLAADFAEVPRIARDSLSRDEFDLIHALQRLARLDRMQVQRCDSGR